MSTKAPASTVSPSGPATVSAAGATGATGTESTPAAQTSTQQPSPADIIAAFVGGEEKSASQAGTEKEGERDKGQGESEVNAETELDTGNLETDTDSTEEQENQDGEGEGEGSTVQGKGSNLDHLIDGLLKDPENKGIRDRMSKLLAEPAKLKCQITDLQNKLKDVEGPPILVGKVTADDPLGGIATEAQLDQALKSAQAWRDWCEDHPEGGQTDPDDEKTAVSAEQVKANLRHARRMLEAAPARREYLSKLNASRERLRTSHPDLFVKDSPLLAEATQLLQDGVITASDPEYMQHAVDLLEGRKARLEREAGKTHITIDPKKAAKAATTTNGTRGSASLPQRPSPGGGGVTKTLATRPAGAEADLAEAKKKAAAGSNAALATVIDAFVS